MNTQIFIPLLLQVFLTIALYLYLAIEKARAVRLGLVDEGRRALYDDAWPEKVLQINNCIRNQFEAPVLFYVMVLVYWNLASESRFFEVAAWAFVISRLAHAWVHAGSNFVPARKKLFMLGCAILLVMAALLSWQLIG
jgi:hypothetical protein